jgi:hypothetical protein
MNVRALTFVVAVWVSLRLLSSTYAQSTGDLLQYTFDCLNGSPEVTTTGITESAFPHSDNDTGSEVFDLGTDYTFTITTDDAGDQIGSRFDIVSGEGDAMHFDVRSSLDHFASDLLASSRSPAINPESFGDNLSENAKPPVEHRAYAWSAADDNATVSVDNMTFTNLVPEAVVLGIIAVGIGLLVLALRRNIA